MLKSPELEVSPTSPYSAGEAYLQSLPPDAYVAVGLNCSQLEMYGSPGFSSTTPGHITLKPVLISEETPDQISATLDKLRESEERSGVAGWTVVSANMSAADSSVAAPVIAAIQKYQKQYPGFGLSFFVQQYQEATPIGTVLRDLYASGVATYIGKQGVHAQNIPLVRCDVDAVDIPTDYFAKIHELYWSGATTNQLLYPHVRHDRLDSDRFPRLNNLLNWYDLTDFVRNKTPDSHYTVDLVGYCKAGGIPPDCSVREVVALAEAMEEVGELKAETLPLTVTISSRHLVANSVHSGNLEYGHLRTKRRDMSSHRLSAPRRDIGRLSYNSQLRSRIGWFASLSMKYRYTQDRDYELPDWQIDGEALFAAQQDVRRLGLIACKLFGNSRKTQRYLKRESHRIPYDINS